MNIQKRCKKCGEFFPVKPKEFKFFCDKCKDTIKEIPYYIKQNRCISVDYFDIFDLDRPIETGYGFERVCRDCGKPLYNKDGKYSHVRRYCEKHNGYELFTKYNWGYVSEEYIRKKRDENKELINLKLKKYNIKTDLNQLVMCEECGALCSIHGSWVLDSRFNVVNVHHIQPVHKLTMENIQLIWDESNFKALCQECHNKQDHYLKKEKVRMYKDITSFCVP